MVWVRVISPHFRQTQCKWHLCLSCCNELSLHQWRKHSILGTELFWVSFLGWCPTKASVSADVKRSSDTQLRWRHPPSRCQCRANYGSPRHLQPPRAGGARTAWLRWSFTTTQGIWEEARKGTAAPQSHWPPATMPQWLVTLTEQPRRHPGCRRSELGKERGRESCQPGTWLCKRWSGVRERVFCHCLRVTARQNLAVRRERKVHAAAGVLLLAAKDLYFALPATLND